MKQLLILLITFFSICFLNAQEFTIGIIPDTQNMSKSDSESQKIKDMMQFFIDKEDSLNLHSVVSLGDIVYGYNSTATINNEYSRVKPAYDSLKKAGIPYVPCFGNHDYDLELFNEWFPLSELEEQNPYFSGYLNGSENTYYLFSEGGIDFVMVVIETHDEFIIEDKGFDYDQASIDWANRIFSSFPERRGVFVTHDLFEWSGYRLVDDVIKKNDNLFMAVCGHSCKRPGFSGEITSEKHWIETSPTGNEVHCLLSNYQCDSDKGATVRYYTINTAEDSIHAFTYNLVDNEYLTGETSQFSFNVDLNRPEEPEVLNTFNTPLYPKSNESVLVSTIIIDNDSVLSATLVWGISSGELENSIQMVSDSNVYSALIPENENGSIIYYAIIATDSDSNQNSLVELSYIVEDDVRNLPCPYNTTQHAYQNQVGSALNLIEAENYNEGCSTVAYFDVDVINRGNLYRQSEAVDIERCNEGGYNVGWISTGEWLNYQIEVLEENEYSFDFRIASSSNGSNIHLEINDEDISGPIDLPATGGWQTWNTEVIHNIPMSAGVQNLKIFADDGDFNFNYFRYSLTSEYTPIIISSSIKNQETSSIIKTYPNPTDDFVYIEGVGSEKANIEIYDTFGKRVSNWERTSEGKKMIFDLSNLSAGVYCIIDIHGNYFTKIVKR